ASAAADYVYVGEWGAAGDGPGEFAYASRLALGPGGDVYVCDRWGVAVQRFGADGRFLAAWDRYPGEAPALPHPHGLACSPDGSVFVTDSLRGYVACFPAAGVRYGWSVPEGEGTPGGFTGIAIGAGGDVYVCDERTGEVLLFDPYGELVGRWGSRGTGPGQFNSPGDVAVAADGKVYVTDTLNCRIQYFTPLGGYVGEWGESGAAAGRFSCPEGLGVASDGTVFVADRYNHRVQYFASDGTCVGAWGKLGKGPGEFNEPTDVAVADDGTVYVVDAGNHRVQYFRPE
ncbi:MAG: NHL repeat-containing protein, partial [Candidatus Coatesbacteria bacterium]